MTRLRLRTPSRLHFGLLGWGPRAERQFGGVGMMIDAPGIDVSARPASRWEFTGPLARRVEQIASSLATRLEETGPPCPPLSIQVHHAAPEHAGLGTGTQLTLAVARLMADFSGRESVSTSRLAALTGRGCRSGIGLHGFTRGGFLIDGGRAGADSIPPLLAHFAFPATWRVVLVIPESPPGRHGTDEVEAFRNLAPPPPSYTDMLCRLLLRRLLPALAEADLPAFGSAMDNLQAAVGDAFAPIQGGRFASSCLTRIADVLREQRLCGVGQSSWGPTLFGFTDDSALSVDRLLESVQRHDLGPVRGIVTSASPRGAVAIRSNAHD